MLRRPNKTDILGYAIITTLCLGLLFYGQYRYIQKSTQAHYEHYKARVLELSSAMESYKTKHGEYPVFRTIEDFSAPPSPLVADKQIASSLYRYKYRNIQLSGSSTEYSYFINCSGDSANLNEYPLFVKQSP